MNAVIQEVASDIFSEIGLETNFTDVESVYCPNLNISQCRVFEENENLTMIVYNPEPFRGKWHFTFTIL